MNKKNQSIDSLFAVKWIGFMLLIVYLFGSVVALVSPSNFFGFLSNCDEITDNAMIEHCQLSVLMWSGPIGLLTYVGTILGKYQEAVQHGHLAFYIVISVVYFVLSAGIMFSGYRFMRAKKKRTNHLRWIFIILVLWALGSVISATLLT